MPIYEYDCEECGRRFELLVRRSDEQALCPECGSTRLRKAFSVFSPQGGGSGGGGAPPAPA